MNVLDRYGPAGGKAVSLDEARAYCRRLAGRQYENFSVLTRFIKPEKRDDFAAVYAFCRWADDLGDEAGSPERALELLAWWRAELARCYEGEATHPVFIALRPTVERFDLPMQLFADLIDAFEQDQTVLRYGTWDQLIDYCRRSADPVGRLVLRLTESPLTDEALAASDATCTALQLTNHWQDVKRDLVERDRIYIPAELNPIDNFESRLRDSISQGYAVDQEFLEETRQVIRACVTRTWPLFEQGEKLLPLLDTETRPIVWLFMSGGQHVLRQIEMWNFETVLHRPKLEKLSKIKLLAQAWLGGRFARGAT